jgi:hypothetical protein
MRTWLAASSWHCIAMSSMKIESPALMRACWA